MTFLLDILFQLTEIESGLLGFLEGKQGLVGNASYFSVFALFSFF